MERLESEAAQHILLDDDREDQQLSRDNEYPDPDSLSTYPWWRDLYLPQDMSNYDERHVSQAGLYAQGQDEYRSDPDLLSSMTPEIDDSNHSAINECSFYPSSSRTMDCDDDSTFELTLEDTSGNSISSLSQACSEDYHHVSQPLTRRKRGRRRGRIRGSDDNHGSTIRRSQKGIKRGPRRPLEPSNEFKSVHALATAAFIDADYEIAEQLTLQAILLNPEMYAAHSLLSEIHSARGDHSKALTALFNGAHTRPRDIEVWETLAHMLLARLDKDSSAVNDALYCYSRIIQVDPHNVYARHQRAVLNRRLGYLGRAATEYEHLLKDLPHDLTILRSLAELYTETDNAHRAMEHYGASIKFYQDQEPKEAKTFTWSDVNIYVELFADQQRYLDGISEIKSLSRWLLGRRGDTLWENFHEDDREWDIDDYPRRACVEGFKAGSYSDVSYGKGMPLELHVKLGTYRLKFDGRQIEEATRQFELLEPGDCSIGATLFKYPDLFRDAADSLRSAASYQTALKYYEPLEKVSGYADISYYADMAFCYKSVGLKAKAEACYHTIMDLERENSSTPTRLLPDASKVTAVGDAEFDIINGTSATPYLSPLSEGVGPELLGSISIPKAAAPSAMLISRPSRLVLKRRDANKRLQMQLHQDKIRSLYGQTQELLEGARSGEVEALSRWTTAAQALVEDFQSHRAFFPLDRSLKIYGQSKTSTLDSLKYWVDQTLHDIVGRAGISSDDLPSDPAVTTGDFRGIPFSAWMDLMLEYSMLLALSQDYLKAYEVLNYANSANIFYSSPDCTFLIHVCWFACAVIANDGETSCTVARWFMKEFQFVTDSYRLFCTINRLCDSWNTWFNCGPTQKFVRRHLKAMDYSLVDQDQRRELYHEKISYTTRDDKGKLISADDMDLALLMLYGYMLYLGRSFALSLNYFFRAFALDPRNPIISLSLALAYIQHAIKRQAANRQHLITQGLSFLFSYYETRRTSRTLSERQEAEFNVARTYHMLGLTHLAIPYYERCMFLGDGSQGVGTSKWDEFSAEAAFALRTIWAADQEMGKATDITQKYLVI